ncbi:MAG: DUF2911 domain-containing protein [Flavobacteriales bacterium]|nr:DUF2911 domain-containing protein [Flavobacteriales bacterium]
MIITKLPLHSPKATVEQTIGVTDVKVSYARPSAKGRKIFGGLVPYGEVWRTAANAGSYITFEAPVVINGTSIPAGQYALLTIPDADSWTVVFNKTNKSILFAPYDESQNVLSITLPVQEIPFIETFTIGFDHLTTDAATLFFAWENTRVSFTVEAPATEQSLKNIDEALAESDATAGNYHNAAAFCLDRGVRLPLALEWAKKSVEAEPKFFTVRTLSLLFAANSLKKEAIEAAKRSLEMSKAAGFDSFVRLNEAKIREWEGELVA